MQNKYYKKKITLYIKKQFQCLKSISINKNNYKQKN